jgi:hypothetical protein
MPAPPENCITPKPTGVTWMPVGPRERVFIIVCSIIYVLSELDFTRQKRCWHVKKIWKLPWAALEGVCVGSFLFLYDDHHGEFRS